MNRAEAYARKVDVIVEAIDLLQGDMDGLNRLERKGVLHAAQESIEAAMDIAAMMVTDAGGRASDDYANIEALKDAKRIDAGLGDRLAALNGLRNAIVHRYNHFEEQVLYDGLEELVDTLTRFAELVP